MLLQSQQYHYCQSQVELKWPLNCDTFVSHQQNSILIQFSSVTQLCLMFCDPMDYSTPDFPVHHQLLELVQTHVLQVNNAIQPSHLLLSSILIRISFSKLCCYCLSCSQDTHFLNRIQNLTLIFTFNHFLDHFNIYVNDPL